MNYLLLLHYLQVDEVFERLDEQIVSEPEEEEASNEIAHAEEGDPSGARDEDNDQRHPEHVLEDARLDVIQVGTGKEDRNILRAMASLHEHFKGHG